MNIPKAIEINTINNDHNPNYTDKEREEAHQLGIEALNRLDDGRSKGYDYFGHLLPSETKD